MTSKHDLQETWSFVNENLTVQAIIFSKKKLTSQSGEKWQRPKWRSVSDFGRLIWA